MQLRKTILASLCFMCLCLRTFQGFACGTAENTRKNTNEQRGGFQSTQRNADAPSKRDCNGIAHR